MEAACAGAVRVMIGSLMAQQKVLERDALDDVKG
jgi:hypothetical protein